MKRNLLILAVFSLMTLGFASIAPNIAAQTRSYRVSDQTVKSLITRIESRTDVFKNELNSSLDSSNLNNTDSEDLIYGYVSNFENAVDQLRQKFDSRSSVNVDVDEVLNQAALINQFMQRNRLTANAQRNWGYLKTDLTTLARHYSTGLNWTTRPVIATGDIRTPTNNNNSPVRGNAPYRAADREVQATITRLETRTDAYKREVNFALDRSVLNNTRSRDSIVAYITEFENATDRLKQNFDARRSTSADVEEVLNRAYFIDGFMRDYRLNARAENEWKIVRTDLDALTNYYNVSWNWNRQYSPASKFDSMISGTYRLNTSQSDNVVDVVGRATVPYAANQRDRVSRNLERRLASPEMLAIEKRDKQVTIASSTAPQITFDADGVAKTETNPNGRTIKVTANTYYDGVSLSYEGERSNDFYVNFVPLSNGQLKVVRRVYLENKNDTITVASVYDKVNNSAQWSVVTNPNAGSINQNNNQNNNQTSQDFVIPNNTRLSAVLRTPISTKSSQNNDRFSMEVTSPSEFNGAIIEGRVTKAERSGQVSGRANLSLEFDAIRMSNGRTYRFTGIVDEVKLTTGEKVTVNNEGTVRDNNQTTKTVTRAGIGAALGALIGAIAGGGQGAAIGAVVGAGAGAGTVILQGRDDVELNQGTEFMLTASAPGRVNSNQ
ncbi:MAG: hypothetical protein H0T08_03885 [Acidobacteria bacterium]|nr:hypothetical protein [Acidobacteriota bacterium]